MISKIKHQYSVLDTQTLGVGHILVLLCSGACFFLHLSNVFIVCLVFVFLAHM